MYHAAQVAAAVRENVKTASAISLAMLVLLLPGQQALASYGIYVGRNLTADGNVFLGGSGEPLARDRTGA